MITAISRTAWILLLTIIFPSPLLAQQLSYEVFPVEANNFPTSTDPKHVGWGAQALVFEKTTNKIWRCRVVAIDTPIKYSGSCSVFPDKPSSLNQNFQIKHMPVAGNPQISILQEIFWFIDQSKGTLEVCNFAWGNPQCWAFPPLP
jgi:hypothetical protein